MSTYAERYVATSQGRGAGLWYLVCRRLWLVLRDPWLVGGFGIWYFEGARWAWKAEGRDGKTQGAGRGPETGGGGP